MLISKGTLAQGSLNDEVAIVTDAGRGIGYEAARALTWLGAKVVIAEINDKTGKASVESLEKEFGEGKVLFVKTDVGSERARVVDISLSRGSIDRVACPRHYKSFTLVQ